MKVKAMMSFALTAKLICAFVFAYVKDLFSHAAAHLRTLCEHFNNETFYFSKTIISVLIAFLYP